MKFNFHFSGLRSLIILVYAVVSVSGLVLLNHYMQHKSKQFKEVFMQMKAVESLSQMHNLSPSDSTNLRNVINSYNEASSVVTTVLAETKLYSSLLLLLIIITSMGIFIFFLFRISKPIIELTNATEQIRRGNLSVYLKETGTSEVKMLKKSFNLMSREMETIQKKLLVAEKEMIWKDLSRILAHEIKNPLTPIQLAIQRLEERYAISPESLAEIFPESVSVIQQEIENLKLLAQDFSSFAKITQPQKEVFNPTEAISEICQSYQNDYALDLKLEPDVYISYDRTHFYQVITNIIQNAIDASKPQDPIEIVLYKEKGFIVISIKDYGCGIDTDDINRIFEPYFTKKANGTGLGLALVKRLCDANQTVVRVKSKVDNGSEFILIIEEVMP